MSTAIDGEQTDDRGGKRSIEALFVEHYAFMFAAARKVLRQYADAEDVIQTLFFKLADSELPADVHKDPKGYLYRTVVNACHDWRRSRKSRKENQGVEELPVAEPRSGRAHENVVHDVEHWLGKLDDHIAGIVMLHADGGLSDAEIASMMGESRSKIAKILSRAREKLRKTRRDETGRPAKGLDLRSASAAARRLEEMPDPKE